MYSITERNKSKIKYLEFKREKQKHSKIVIYWSIFDTKLNLIIIERIQRADK